MRRSRLTMFLAAWAVLPGASPVHAAPQRESVTVEDGHAEDLYWENCAPQSVSYVTSAPPTATAFPPAGDVDEASGLVTTAVTVENGIATWTFAPTAEVCPPGATAPTRTVEFVDDAVRLRWRDRRYVLRATGKDGVRSFAGWKANRDGRSSVPTVRSARRHFGRPSKVGKSRYQACPITWQKLGLRITFANYGGRSACTDGFAQSAEILDPSKWTLKVGTRPGIVETSQFGYLYARSRVTELDDGWALAEYFSPFAEAGFYPSILAHGTEDGEITSADVWVGAAGE